MIFYKCARVQASVRALTVAVSHFYRECYQAISEAECIDVLKQLAPLLPKLYPSRNP